MRNSVPNENSRFPKLEELYEQAVSDLLTSLSAEDRKRLTEFCLAYREEVAPYQICDRLNATARLANEPIRFFDAGVVPLRLIVSN